jgi:hypothetical protein
VKDNFFMFRLLVIRLVLHEYFRLRLALGSAQ